MSNKIQIIDTKQITKNNPQVLTYYVCDFRGENRVFLLTPLIDKQIVLWISPSSDGEYRLGWDNISVLDECRNTREVTDTTLTFYV